MSSEGLGVTPTVQMIDMSHNHLQRVEDLEKLCLLLTLDVSSNNLLEVRTRFPTTETNTVEQLSLSRQRSHRMVELG